MNATLLAGVLSLLLSTGCGSSSDTLGGSTFPGGSDTGGSSSGGSGSDENTSGDDPGSSSDIDLCDGNDGDCVVVDLKNVSGERIVGIFLYDQDCYDMYGDVLQSETIEDGEETFINIHEGNYCGMLACIDDCYCAYSGEFTLYSGDEGPYWKVTNDFSYFCK